MMGPLVNLTRHSQSKKKVEGRYDTIETAYFMNRKSVQKQAKESI